MNIVMFGPQGSGKGTQADRLANYLGTPMISVGVLFRAEIARGTGLGKAIKEYVEKGEMVPLSIVNTVMHERLQEDDTAKGMVIDGYPRKQEQAVELDKILAEIGKSVTHVIYLDVSDAVAKERMEGRHRGDDTPDVIEHRLQLYHHDTEPLLRYYQERGILYRVNGEQDIDAVEREVRTALGV
jgi:adenylate kinase